MRCVSGSGASLVNRIRLRPGLAFFDNADRFVTVFVSNLSMRLQSEKAEKERSIGEGQGLAHLLLAFRFPRHTVTAKVINLIVI